MCRHFVIVCLCVGALLVVGREAVGQIPEGDLPTYREARYDLEHVSIDEALDLVLNGRMSATDVRFILYRSIYDGRPGHIDILHDIASVYYDTQYRFFAQQALYAMAMIGESGSSLVDIALLEAETRPLLASFAVLAAGTRPDSADFARLEVLRSLPCPVSCDLGAYQIVLRREESFRALDLDQRVMFATSVLVSSLYRPGGSESRSVLVLSVGTGELRPEVGWAALQLADMYRSDPTRVRPVLVRHMEKQFGNLPDPQHLMEHVLRFARVGQASE